jgi:hypothetical protein
MEPLQLGELTVQALRAMPSPPALLTALSSRAILRAELVSCTEASDGSCVIRQGHELA